MVHRLTPAQTKVISKKIDAWKRANKSSNVKIGKKAGYNESVVRGAIHERCRTYETLKKICTSLDIDLDRSLEEAGLSNDGRGPGID